LADGFVEDCAGCVHSSATLGVLIVDGGGASDIDV
jgi:hypothetical protein